MCLPITGQIHHVPTSKLTGAKMQVQGCSGLLHTQRDLELCFGWQPSPNMGEDMVEQGTTATRLPLQSSAILLGSCVVTGRAMAQLASEAEKSPWILHLLLAAVWVLWMQGEQDNIALCSLLLAVQLPCYTHPMLQPSWCLRNVLENHKTLSHKGRHQKSRWWDSTKSFISETWVTSLWKWREKGLSTDVKEPS